jgi:methylthioribose-1-phosphate isomerase
MRKLESRSFRFDGDKIWILDQKLLPQEKQWIDVTDPAAMVLAIQKLQVRGAPLIGVAAAVCLARQVEKGLPEKDFRKTAELLREARPTAVNLMVAIDRLLQFADRKFNMRQIVEATERIFSEDVELCEKIARNGEELVADGDGILTHCNTGGLATAGVGTAIGIIQRAQQNGKKIHVYVDETRPLLQGGRLTAWEMKELNIPHTLICDNMAAIMMREGRVQKVIVGCDRIALNGDFANKVGTYGLAILAHYHKIPFYVAGPYTTIDPNCQSGAEIPIEERKPEEVRGVSGAFGEALWAPVECPVRNPAFDVTPADLVSAWILDKQVLYPEDIKSGGLLACMPL